MDPEVVKKGYTLFCKNKLYKNIEAQLKKYIFIHVFYFANKQYATSQ